MHTHTFRTISITVEAREFLTCCRKYRVSYCKSNCRAQFHQIKVFKKISRPVSRYQNHNTVV